tara:strand:+ start:2736 stop:3377 length:642 start_codon:yes stop_codon:yes gene_type:complete
VGFPFGSTAAALGGQCVTVGQPSIIDCDERQTLLNSSNPPAEGGAGDFSYDSANSSCDCCERQFQSQYTSVCDQLYDSNCTYTGTGTTGISGQYSSSTTYTVGAEVWIIGNQTACQYKLTGSASSPAYNSSSSYGVGDIVSLGNQRYKAIRAVPSGNSPPSATNFNGQYYWESYSVTSFNNNPATDNQGGVWEQVGCCSCNHSCSAEYRTKFG